MIEEPSTYPGPYLDLSSGRESPFLKAGTCPGGTPLNATTKGNDLSRRQSQWGMTLRLRLPQVTVQRKAPRGGQSTEGQDWAEG